MRCQVQLGVYLPVLSLAVGLINLVRAVAVGLRGANMLLVEYAIIKAVIVGIRQLR